MLAPDVNILLYAFRTDSKDHERYREWLTDALQGDEPVGISDLALSSVIRMSTHPGIFHPPSAIADALIFTEQVRSADSAVPLTPGPRHWEIFADLCREPGVRGNLVPDAYFAAMAIENGAEWVTNDGDFARFPGLKRSHPFR